MSFLPSKRLIEMSVGLSLRDDGGQRAQPGEATCHAPEQPLVLLLHLHLATVLRGVDGGINDPGYPPQVLKRPGKDLRCELRVDEYLVRLAGRLFLEKVDRDTIERSQLVAE